MIELVKGVPITEYCEQNGLSIAERLDLFVLVCQAVQHAHLKGIIHRDLKPSNVLIPLHDGTPVPKVIDFGIAQATGQPHSRRTAGAVTRPPLPSPPTSRGIVSTSRSRPAPPQPGIAGVNLPGAIGSAWR